MRLAKPEIVRGFPYPGLSVDEINSATGQMWTDERFQIGANREEKEKLHRQFKEENKSELADLRDNYNIQRSNISASMRTIAQNPQRIQALDILRTRYRQNMRHMEEAWMRNRA